MDKLKPIVEEVVEAMGFYLYEMNFNKRDDDYVLSIEIDHADPISIDDCVKVSDAIGDVLDEKDIITQAYMLEVSSAGAEHPLRDEAEMTRAIGKFVHINREGTIYEGTLIAVNADTVELLEKTAKKPITIAMNEIKTIRLAIDF